MQRWDGNGMSSRYGMESMSLSWMSLISLIRCLKTYRLWLMRSYRHICGISFAGRYPVEIPVDIATISRLELITDFYARYNREFLYLDGSWTLMGHTCSTAIRRR